MSKANNYDVVLEKVGNQPLKTTKILCETLGLGLAKAKGMVDKVPTTIASDIDSAKALDLKKQLEAIGNTVSVPGLKVEEESSAPAKKAIYTDNDFDAIFGGGAAAKATPPVTRKSTTKTEPKATATPSSVKATPSSVKATPKAEKKKSASSNDAFDALFSGTTTGSSTAKKTSTTKTAPKKTTSKAPAASSDSFDSLFGGATPKKETKEQPKASVAKTMRKKYSNGVYEGEMKDGEPHGFGTYRWNDGDVYTGEYVNGIRHGKGKFVFASGNYYDGNWVDGKYHGHGIFRWSDGDEFDGEWQNGQRHGKGKWTYGDGRYYTGVWENGESISSSSIIYPSNATTATKTAPKAAEPKIMRKEYSNGSYEGEMKDGEPHGFGTYRWNDGDVYTGEYVNGTRHGKGKFVFVSGNYYDGEWVDGKYNGHGIFRWSDGGEFDGEWKNGKRHGKGKWTYTNGSYYTGVWENGENVSSSQIIYPQASSVATGKSQGQTISSKSNVLDCSDKATQAYNNKDYFRCAYYLHRGGLSGDDFYCRVSGMCYHPSGATGYDYVEKILTSKSLKYISDEDIDVCAFVLDKFVPKGTKDSKIYRAWCYYRAGRLRKAAGMIPNRGLMFYNGRIQDISEVLGGRPLSSITPYSDEIMANLFRCKLWVKLDMENDWVSQLRKNERLKEKLLLAEEYVKFAKKERWEYELREVEEDVLVFKAALR